MNAIYSSNDQEGSINHEWDFTSSANQESPSNKIYTQAAIRKQIIQSNPEKIKSPTSYQAILSNRPRKNKMVNTSINPCQEKKSSLKRHQVK